MVTAPMIDDLGGPSNDEGFRSDELALQFAAVGMQTPWWYG
jgi:hypothetical protein